MLKGYKRHFIVSNMVLTGLVLLVSFVVLGGTMYKYQCTELKNTMSIVIKPWDHANERFHDDENRPHRSTEDMPPERKPRQRLNENAGNMRGLERDITTVFYNKREGSLSFLSNNSSIDEDFITEIVQEIIDKPEDFDTLKEFGVIYYKEESQTECKIALTSDSYITSRLFKSFVILTLVFFASMAIIFFISLRLSKTAAKPMENAIEMERNFVADISHDLKTPITVILTNNSILKSNPDTAVSEHKQWIDSTETAAKAMMKMVNEMLALSSLESVSKKIEKTSVSLTSAAEKCVLQMESLAYERSIIVNEDIGEDVYIQATQELAEKLCSGLLDNALKYEPDGGEICVEVKTERKHAVLRITNKGSTIDPDDLPHIFERFYRGDKTRRMKTGHGLGLPIINQITELLDAKIIAESSPAKGTVFTVTFPMSEN